MVGEERAHERGRLLLGHAADHLDSVVRPDIADQLTAPSTKTWFGPRRKLVRHDSHWQIADTLLPFDPRGLEAVS